MSNIRKASHSTHKAVVLPHLIKYVPKNYSSKSTVVEPKIYAFDLDHTVIKPKFEGRFSKSENDWKFMTFTSGPEKKSVETIDVLSDLLTANKDSHVVIFSNQGGTVTVPPNSKSCTKFTGKIDLILRAIADRGLQLEERIWLYASPKKPASLSSTRKQKGSNGENKVMKNSPFSMLKAPQPMAKSLIFESMRKPNGGMFEEFTKDFGQKFKLEYYCGDAAGRSTDFSDSDKQFALTIGAEFLTPEEVFH
ncbi:LAFA_0G09604g1_1 [Lachancea sp. 'fantastica']|nr:LAFA_0G09604g1_1 [Lachancea sp. 'fantastica']